MLPKRAQKHPDKKIFRHVAPTSHRNDFEEKKLSPSWACVRLRDFTLYICDYSLHVDSWLVTSWPKLPRCFHLMAMHFQVSWPVCREDGQRSEQEPASGQAEGDGRREGDKPTDWPAATTGQAGHGAQVRAAPYYEMEHRWEWLLLNTDSFFTTPALLLMSTAMAGGRGLMARCRLFLQLRT